ncbi:MAG: type I methionyl aminopeptidase [Myxococcales bacterium]|nr:type I methionyl aminopeptidase [Myxococcales bacterium]MCA9678148.1 type I methionyl aminopeptidase [Myxococcales bacterium]MCB9564315.1 type I methionyl aminopeptidase [Kofleriaceae bacterium]
MRIQLKSLDEIRLMREAGLVVSSILDEVCAAVAPGVSTWELDKLAAKLIEKHKVTSAFLGYYDYPAVLCTSINEVVVHGIPRKEHVLQDGDIIGIDFGIFKHGFCADSARTILCGDVIESTRKLVDVTRESLNLAIDQCRVGKRLGDIGHAVQTLAESNGYSVVRVFVGHGIGTAMHEDPGVPNYGRANEGKRLKQGLVIAVEPMVNAGASDVEVLDDAWTAVTKDRKLSAHFEHTIAILDDGPWVLTRASSRPGDPGRD